MVEGSVVRRNKNRRSEAEEQARRPSIVIYTCTLWDQPAEVHLLTLPTSSSVTLGKLPNIFMPCLFPPFFPFSQVTK